MRDGLVIATRILSFDYNTSRRNDRCGFHYVVPCPYGLKQYFHHINTCL